MTKAHYNRKSTDHLLFEGDYEILVGMPGELWRVHRSHHFMGDGNRIGEWQYVGDVGEKYRVAFDRFRSRNTK